MMLSAGARLGPYELVSLVGAGGMGEVFKARDTRLERIVAIKLLPPDLAERPDRRRRFETEARAISSLSHPHICTLFDVGSQDGHAYLVMEYLEGETLDDRLASGPLPIDTALEHAAALADALDHAHRLGIVHRDLKPSNVMLTAAGAKLLDFGLAKGPMLDAAAPLSTASIEPGPQTAEGTLIGTFQYMAPEQLEGKPADARTDVFALGTLLYEMATGRKAFEGKSQASLIASILTQHPPAISTARTALDSDGALVALDHIVERCLAKNPDERWQTARDVKLELEWIAKGALHHAAAAPLRARLRPREAVAWALALAAIIASTVLWLRPAAISSPDTTRFIVSPPPGTTIGVAENRTRLAISPDGRRLAFVGFTEGRQQIWLQSLDAIAAQPLPGTEGGVSPFWSPDSRSIGFFSPADGELKRIAAPGGPVRTICRAQIDGAPTWGRDGTILFTEFPGGGIQRVSADGGTPAHVTAIDKDKHELNHYWPEFLPDGRHFLFMATALDANGLRATPSLYVGSLDGGGTTLVTRMHSRVAFVPPHHLLFAQDGALLAQTFDPGTFKLGGEPIQIANGMAYFRTLGNAAFTVSSNGVLAYQGSADPFELRWYDRQGTATPSGWATQSFGSIRLSPTGERVVVDVADPRIGTSDLWIYDVAHGAPVRFTTDLTTENQPVWSPGGRRVLFRSERGGSPHLYAKAVGTGEEELLVKDESPLSPEDWSADGRWLAYVRNTRQTSLDLWLMPLGGGGQPVPFSTTRFDEWSAKFSPDSRWLAFASTESGSPEVYVAPVQAPGDRRPVSLGGGSTPRWRQDGRELFYVSPDRRSIMAVALKPGSGFTAGIPTRLFTIGEQPAAQDRARNVVYDVSPDGQRFLVSVKGGEPSSSQVTVVLNWTGALGR